MTSKPPNFGKPMDYSHHFHQVCYTGFRPTCAYMIEYIYIIFAYLYFYFYFPETKKRQHNICKV